MQSATAGDTDNSRGPQMLLETMFGTLWAWLWLAETPTAATFAAIVIIVATLFVFYARQARVARQRRYCHGHELPR